MTIAVFNHKGGVGKTTTTVNLGAYLAEEFGLRVLVVDMAPQGNATRAVIERDLDEGCATMKHVLLGEVQSVTPLREIVVNTEIVGLCVAPADLTLSEAEFRLVHRVGRELILHESLKEVASVFDFILIDCPPSVGLLALNALATADNVVIPCETQFLSLRGLRHVLDVLKLVREKLNPEQRILGVLATKFHVLSKANNEALACLRGLKSVRIFDAVIPRDVKAEEAPSHGNPLALYAPNSHAAVEYRKLAREVMRLCHD